MVWHMAWPGCTICNLSCTYSSIQNVSEMFIDMYIFIDRYVYMYTSLTKFWYALWVEMNSVQGLTDEEIRELLTDYVGRQGCWGARPAHEWPISKVEDCNVYIGTLETFIEEREVKKQVKPYSGGQVDDKSSGPPPGPWEVDMRHEFPLLFTPSKEARQKLLHSEAVERCPGATLATNMSNSNEHIFSRMKGPLRTKYQFYKPRCKMSRYAWF